MDKTQAVIVYAVCWWLIFFMALPFGIKTGGHTETGAEPGAPQKTYLGRKIAIVTVLAFLATWAIDFVIASGIVAVR